MSEHRSRALHVASFSLVLALAVAGPNRYLVGQDAAVEAVQPPAPVVTLDEIELETIRTIARPRQIDGGHTVDSLKCCPGPTTPLTPNMIGDVFFGGIRTTSRDISRFIGYPNGGLVPFPTGGELIPVDLPVAANQRLQLPSKAIGSTFQSINQASAFTTQTVIALDSNPDFLNRLQQAFPGSVLVSSQAVPEGLIGQLPGIGTIILGDPTEFNPQPDAVISLPESGVLLGPFPNSVPDEDLTFAGGTPLTLPGTDPRLFYAIVNTFNIFGRPTIEIPIPGAGTRYARVSHNNSPLPRDRVFVNYDWLTDILFSSEDARLITVGYEKVYRYNDMFYSLQIDVPFTSTIDSDTIISNGLSGSSGQFGNVTLWWKALYAWHREVAVSFGLGLNTPTADDVNLFSLPGAGPLIRVQNNSTHVSPFIGLIYQPSNSRSFYQGFVQIDADLNGNKVDINLGEGLVRAGALDSTSLFYADIGAGYMLYQSHDQMEWLQSIIPMVELHFTKDIDTLDVIETPIGILHEAYQKFSMFNLTAGVNFAFGQRTNLNLGVGVPLRGEPEDRSYDWAANAQLNVILD